MKQRNKKTKHHPRQAYIFFFTLSFFLIQACTESPPDTIDCGNNQIEVNGSCECKDGYHWNEDETKCLMDTTSHNFVWEIDTLGEGGSYLNDVAIIDENNVWVVGNIETDSGRYNLAKWDGYNWVLENVGPVGNNLYNIFAFDGSNVWVANSCSPYHWNGTEWTYYRFSTGGVGVDACAGNAIWGGSPNDIYFVGSSGSIVHYDGLGFTKIESGTNASLVAIKGIVDSQTGETVIWVAGLFTLLYFDGNDWSVIWDEEHPFFEDNFNNPLSLYIPDEEVVVVSVWGGSNSGTYALNQKNPEDWTLLFNHDIYAEATAGNALNDIMIAGDFHKIMHYNGNTVQNYQEFEGNGFLHSMSFINNQYFIVGSIHATNQGIIFRSIRP